jgi:hypothetical protein
MTFKNNHPYASPVISSDSGGKNSASVIAVNQSSTGSISTTQQLSLSAPWINAGKNGEPTIQSTLSSAVVEGSTMLSISDNSFFPTNGYQSVYQNGVGFLLPTIGRVAGTVNFGTNSVPFALTGEIPKSLPFGISINGNSYNVISVTNSIDGNSKILTLDSSLLESINDLSPILLSNLEVGGSYKVLDVPNFYITQPLMSGVPTPTINTTPIPCDIPAGTTIVLNFGNYEETCLVGQNAMAGDTTISLASATFSGVGTGVQSIVMTTGTTVISTFNDEFGNSNQVSSVGAGSMDMGMVSGAMAGGISTLGLNAGSLVFGGSASAVITANAYSSLVTQESVSSGSTGTAPSTVSVNFLLVGGGGSTSGLTYAGGGGGSVFASSSAVALPFGFDIPIVVGAGGAVGSAGGNSAIGTTFTANGGGVGVLVGGNSGSHTGGTSSLFATGGGAGAGGNGTNGTGAGESSSAGGNGGAGVSSSITGSSVTYGAGGGGWSPNVTGGNGTGYGNAGSGGSSAHPTGYVGLVVLSVPTASITTQPIFTGTAPSITTVGTNTVYTWSSAGTYAVRFPSPTTATSSTATASISPTVVTYSTTDLPSGFVVQKGQVLVGLGIPSGTTVISVGTINGTSGTFTVNQPVSFNSTSTVPTAWLSTPIKSIIAPQNPTDGTYVSTVANVGSTPNTSYYTPFIPVHNYDASIGNNGQFTFVGTNVSVLLSSNLSPQQKITLTTGMMFTGNTNAGSGVITNVLSSMGITSGQMISGNGIQFGSMIDKITLQSNGTYSIYLMNGVSSTITQTSASFMTVGATQTLTVNSNINKKANHIFVEPFSPIYAFDSMSSLIAPYGFSLDSGEMLETVYPIALPMSMNTNGKAPYALLLSEPVAKNHTAKTPLLYFALPSPVDAGSVVYRPDYDSLVMYDGSHWRDSRIASVRGNYSIIGSINGGDKSTISFVDTTSNASTATDVVANTNNTTPTTTAGGLHSFDANGVEWTPSGFNKHALQITAVVPPLGSINYQSVNAQVSFKSAPQPTRVWLTPHDDVVLNTNYSNYVSWDYSDLDNDPQTDWQVKIFDQFTFNSFNFSPSTSPATWSARGSNNNNEVEIPLNSGLKSGEQYWAYVQVAKTFNKQPWWGNWVGVAFNVVVLQPQPPLMSAFADTDTAINKLVIQASDNLMSSRNAEFSSSSFGWDVDNNDTASTNVYVSKTGIVPSTKLSSTTAITSIPVGSSGYLNTPMPSTAGSGTFIMVSGNTRSKTEAPGFPSKGDFWISIGNEKILVSRVQVGSKTTTEQFMIKQRGYMGTSIASHPSQSVVTFPLQEDIFAGTIGTFYYQNQIHHHTDAVTKQVPSTATGTVSGSTSSGSAKLKVLIGTKGQRNKSRILVDDPNNLLKKGNGSYPTVTIDFGIQASSTNSNTKNTTPANRQKAQDAAFAKATAAQKIEFETLTIKSVTGGISQTTPTGGATLIASVKNGVIGGKLTNSGKTSSVSSLTVTPSVGNLYKTIPAGQSIYLQGPNGAQHTVKLTKDFALFAPPSMTSSVIYFTPITADPGFGVVYGHSSAWSIPAGTKIYWNSPKGTITKGTTHKEVTFTTPVNSGAHRNQDIMNGDYITLGITNTTTSSGGTQTVTVTPAKDWNTTQDVYQEFVVAQNTSSGSGELTFTNGSANQIIFTGTITAQSNVITSVTGYSGLAVGAILSHVNIPNGTTVTAISTTLSGTTVTISDIATASASGASIVSNNFNVVSGLVSSVNVVSNQYAGYIFNSVDVPINTTIVSNTSCSANGSFSVTLNHSGFASYPDGTLSVPHTTLETISIYPVSGTANQANIIPAGSTSIPVVPFTPCFDFPAFATSITLEYPAIFGKNVLIVDPQQNGTVELTAEGTNAFSTSDENRISITPGNTYGLMGYSKVLSGSGMPSFQPYILWYDAYGNEIFWDYGINSLQNTPVAITSISGNGTTATVITASAHNLSNGQYIVIRGNSISGYNDVFGLSDNVNSRWVPITVTGTNTFTFKTTVSGYGLGGTVFVVNNFDPAVILNDDGHATSSAGASIDFSGHSWTPNAIVGVAPENFIVANQATFEPSISDNGYTGYFYVPAGLNIALNAGTQMTASNGVVYTLETTSPAGANTIGVRFDPSTSSSKNFIASLVENTQTIYVDSVSGFYVGQAITGAGIPANTYISSVNKDTISLTLSELVLGHGNFTLTTYGNSITGTTDLTISAFYAVPAFSWRNALQSDVYALSAIIFKALTAPTPTGYTQVNSLIPPLQTAIVNTGGKATTTLSLPVSTPVEGSDTFYLLDPVNDFGTREMHQGAYDPVLFTTTTASANKGDNSINIISTAGLSAGSTLLIGWGSSAEEQVTVSDVWDGTNTVPLVSALRNNHAVSTQVYAIVAGITGQVQNDQAVGTQVAVFSWNNSGWLDSATHNNYYFTAERSENEGVSWDAIFRGQNIPIDASGVAYFNDYYVVPGAPTFYRLTGWYNDATVSPSVLTKGVPSSALYSPVPQTTSWWISSSSDPDNYRFAIQVQNALQETQKHPVGVFYPLGSSRPFTISGVPQGRDATINIIWKDQHNWNRFVHLLNLGEILVLIDPVEQERRYIFVNNDITATHQSGASGPWREIQLSYVETAPPNFGFTYGA